MIHFRENCECETYFPSTGICTQCAWYNHMDFIRRYKNGLDSPNVTEQKILIRLRNEPDCKLRIGSKRHTACGHPGVWQGSVCAFCAQDKRDARATKLAEKKQENDHILEKALHQLREKIAELQKQEKILSDALQLKKMGLDVGDVMGMVKLKSPRQQAISEGKRWYMPYEPCKHCGVIAERYVANGKCRNCQQ